MVDLIVCPTYAAVEEVLGLFAAETKQALATLQEKTDPIEQAYRTRTDYDRKVCDELELKNKTIKWSLSADTQKELFQGCGKGLTIHHIVEVYAKDVLTKAVYFFADQNRLPPIQYVGDGPFLSITTLVKGIKENITEQEARYHGATIHPLFFTVAEPEDHPQEEPKTLLQKVSHDVGLEATRSLTPEEIAKFSELF